MTSTRFPVFLIIFLIGCLSCLTLLLIIQTIKLQQTIEQLRSIRDEYKNYLQEIRPYQKNRELEDHDLLQNFLPVNRAHDYLKSSALEFAKEHQLEQAVAAIYGGEREALLHAYRETDFVASLKSKPLKKVSLRLPQEVRHFRVKDFAGQWPLHRSEFWLSSKFGPRRKHDGSLGFHYGIDMAALKGTAVYAIADGVVKQAVYSDLGYGNSIVIGHNKKYSTRYAHLDSLCVKKGEKVKKGMLIGRVGATGSVRGKNASHLHFEVQVFGKRINPLYILT